MLATKILPTGPYVQRRIKVALQKQNQQEEKVHVSRDTTACNADWQAKGNESARVEPKFLPFQ